MYRYCFFVIFLFLVYLTKNRIKTEPPVQLCFGKNCQRYSIDHCYLSFIKQSYNMCVCMQGMRHEIGKQEPCCTAQIVLQQCRNIMVLQKINRWKTISFSVCNKFLATLYKISNLYSYFLAGFGANWTVHVVVHAWSVHCDRGERRNTILAVQPSYHVQKPGIVHFNPR